MGATVNELTVISLSIEAGARVAKGQKIGELESDKSVFEFESPCEGTVRAVHAKPGDAKPSGAVFLQIETSDESLRHLRSASPGAKPHGQAAPAAALVWTPRATKLALEAGLDPASAAGIEATGPGGRVSGDDVAAYLRKAGK
jgi:pyruvate/2-oxoglutarate dehydrogenase complex dihydrolipoamide acyltransferase (E2) component